MDDPSESWEEEFKRRMEELDRKLGEVDELKESLKREAEEFKATKRDESRGPRKPFRFEGPHVKIKVGEDELEPGVEIAANLSQMIRDSIRRSFAQIGEDTLSDIVEEMPEDMASTAMRSVSTPERVKILKLLYTGSKSYGEIAKAFPEDTAKSSLQHHLQRLRNVRLIERDEVSGNYDLMSRGRSLLRLMAIFYGALRGGELEDGQA